MKLTIGLKLKPTAKQVAALHETLQLPNQAANDVSRIAWETQTLGQYQLHKLTYSLVRQKYKLSGQVAVRVIAKVAEAFKLDKKAMRVFRKDGIPSAKSLTSGSFMN